MANRKANELPHLRRTAESWRNAGVVSASIALVAGIISGPELVQNLPEPWHTVTLLVLAVASLGALLSVGLAVRASIGWPTDIIASEPDSLEKWEGDESKRVASLIRSSMVWALVTAIAAGVVIGVVLVVPARHLTVIVTTDGRTFCSSHVDGTSKTTSVQVGQLTVSIPEDEVLSASTVDECP